MVIKDITNKAGEVFLKAFSKYGYVFLKSKAQLKKKMPWGEVRIQFYVTNYNPKFYFTYSVGFFFKEVSTISNHVLQGVYDHMGLDGGADFEKVFRVPSYDSSKSYYEYNRQYEVYSESDIDIVFDKYVKEPLLDIENEIIDKINSIKDLSDMILDERMGDPKKAPFMLPNALIVLKLAREPAYQRMVEEWAPYFPPIKGTPGYVGIREHCLKTVEYLDTL